MHFSWLPRVAVVAIISFVLALLRKYAPAPPSKFESWKYDQRQIPEPLPSGVIGGFMWLAGICLLLTFLIFRAANHAWAQLDSGDMLHLYPTLVLWCFFPFFAALSVPWPLTVWLLRRNGRQDEADAIAEKSNQQAGMNSFVVMKWLALGLAVPIGFLTLLAIPIHLSIGEREARLGHYASISEESFYFGDVKRVVLIDGVPYRDGTFHPHRDLLIDFRDGRRLRLDSFGDEKSGADPKVIELLVSRIGIQPQHARIPDEIPPE